MKTRFRFSVSSVLRKIRVSFILLFSFIASLSNISAQSSIDLSTYLSGDVSDIGTEMVIENGITHILGYSSSSNFPNTFGNSNAGSADLVYTKLDANGNILFSRYIGGSLSELSFALRVENGEAYILASTGSTDFPVTDATSFAGGDSELVIVKLDNLGNVVYATYLGGMGAEKNARLEVENGEVYVVALTNSPDWPVTDGSTNNGNFDITYTRYNASGTIAVSTYIGGSAEDFLGRDIQVLDGVTHFIGSSTSTDYPVTNGSANSGNSDLVYTRVNKSGNITFATYIGGSGNDINGDFEIEGDDIHIFMNTSSTDFPVTDGGVYQGGDRDIAYVKLNNLGNIEIATILGGSATEEPIDIDLFNNEIHLFGRTTSGDYPATNGSASRGSAEMVYTKLDALGNILFSTYYGGSDLETGTLMEVNNDGVHLFGTTRSPDFPVTDNTSGLGNYDSYYVKIGNTETFELATRFSGAQYDYLSDAWVLNNKIYLLGSSLSNDYPVTNGGSILGARAIYYTVIDICPTGYNTPTTVTPATQNVCQNGLVSQITADKVSIPSSSLPIIYRNGSSSSQSEIEAEYQWQEGTSATGPWTDIPGSIQRNYSPAPTVTNKYYRRIASLIDCCGGTILATSDVASIIVSGNAAPSVDAGGIFNTCPGTGVIVGGSPSASGGTAPYMYEWVAGNATSSFSTAPNPTVTPGVGGNTILTLTVTDNNGCQQIDQAIVNSYEADAGPDVGFCEGTSGVQIGGTPVAGLAGVSYSWTPTTNLSCTTCAQPMATPAATTTYTLTLTIPVTGGGTCNTNDDVIVTPVLAPVTPNFAGPDIVVCLGVDGNLGEPAEAGFNYAWAPGNYLTANNTAETTCDFGNLNMPSPNPITYYLTAEKDGCIFVDEVVAAAIEARAGDDGCGPRYVGEPDRTPNITEIYSWTKVSGTGNFTGVQDEDRVPVSATPSGSTTYRLDVTYNSHTCTDFVIVPPCGCNVDIEVVAPFDCPDFGLNGGDVKLVATASDIFSNDPDVFTYTWSPAVGLSATTGREVYLTDDVPRTYTVTMTSPFDPTFMCTDMINVNDPAWALPVFNAADVTTCSGSPIQIGAPTVAGYSYEWTGETLSSTTISDPIATTASTADFYVTVTDVGSGCITKDTSTVTVPGVIASAGSDILVCDNGVVTLGNMSAQPNTTYSWSPAGANWQNGTDQNSPAPDVLVASNTSFTVTVTDTPTSCTSTDGVEVVVGTPIPSFSLPGLSYCPSDGSTLTLGSTAPSGAGYTYEWSPASPISSASAQMPTVNNPKPGSETTFTLIVRNADGCEQIAPQTITPSDMPFSAGSDQSMCSGETIELGSATNPTGGGITYSWSPTTNLSSSTSPNPTFTTTTAGTYLYTLTKNEGGCINSDNVTVTVNEYDLATLSSMTICQNACIEIGTATEFGVQYFWNPSTNLSDPNISNPTACVSTSTTYTLTAIDLNGCADMEDVLVAVNPLPAPDITIPAETECLGATGVTFNPSVTPAGTYNYVWSPNDGTLSDIYAAMPEVYLTEVGTKTYDVIVTNTSSGCYSTGEANLTVNNCACTINNMALLASACNPAGDTYDLAITLTYANPPSGNLTINHDGTDYTFTPTGVSPETFNITGLQANGLSNLNVTATFDNDSNCTASSTYNAPDPCRCDITFTSIDLTACSGSSPATTDLQVVVTWDNAPVGEDITVSLADGTSSSINVSGGATSPQTITFSGLTANSSENNPITASFTTTTTCAASSVYNLPCVDCQTEQFTIDWNALGFVEDVNNPIHEDTYVDNVNYEDNPYHGFATSTGGITANWQSQSFANVAGSGIGMTLHFSPNPIGSNGGSTTTGPNLYGSSGGTNPDCQVTGEYALRMVNDKQGTITPFTAIMTFDEPILIDELIIGSMSRVSGNYENGVIRAFTGPTGTGSTVPATTYQNISDLNDDSSLIHNLGNGSCTTNNQLTNIALDPGSANNTYHFMGQFNQTDGRYGRVKFGWSTPVQSIAFSTWKTVNNVFDDRTYMDSPHSVIFAPLTFSKCDDPCHLQSPIWTVDEDAGPIASMHFWSFDDYNNASTTGTDYGRVKYYHPIQMIDRDLDDAGDLEALAINRFNGQAYFLGTSDVDNGPGSSQALFTYNVNDAAANSGNIVFTLLGHITRPSGFHMEALAFDPITRRLYTADPKDSDQNSSTTVDDLYYIDISALNADPMQVSAATLVGPIQGAGEFNHYVDGLEITDDGTMYAVDGTDQHLYEIDENTAAIIVVQDDDIPGGIAPTTDVESITWDEMNNKLIALDEDSKGFLEITLGLPGGGNMALSSWTGAPGINPIADFESSGMFSACAMDLLSIGNLVYIDANSNDGFDAGEGITNVTVQLYLPGDDPATTIPVAEVTTDVNGNYIFEHLIAGNYFVHIPASNFGASQPLENYVSLAGNGSDDKTDDDSDENGIDNTSPVTFGISSAVINLSVGNEPENASTESGNNNTLDDVIDNNGDLTIDFGFKLDDCADYANLLSYISTAPANNNTERTSWLNSILNHSDYLQDFETYAVNDNLDNTDIGGIEFRLRNLDGGGITAQTGTGGSNFIDTRGAMIPSGNRLRIFANNDEFSYVGFYVYNLDVAATLDIEFKDGPAQSIVLDATGTSCADCGEFIGLVAPEGDFFDRIEITPIGTTDWGIDNIQWGNFSRSCGTCPMITHWDMENCEVGDLDSPGFPAITNTGTCATISVTNLTTVNSTGNSCGSSNASIGRNMCFGDQNDPSWNDNDPEALQWDMTFGASESGNLERMIISHMASSTCPGNSNPNNAPQRFGLRVLKDGVEIYRNIDLPVLVGTFVTNELDFSGTPEFTYTGPVTFHFELLSYDPAANGGSCEIWDVDEIEIYGCCSSACSLTDIGEALETCNDNGTNSDASDDYITFSLNPTGTGLGATYSVTVDNGATVTLAAGGPATGVSYGSATAFRLQDGSADGATTYTITVEDVDDPTCTITTTVAQGSCSTTCSLNAISNFTGTCADNGTTSNASDDYMTFSINPAGFNTSGNGYNVTATQGGNPITITLNAGGPATNVAYGSATTFRTPVGTAGAGDVTVTVTDATDAGCSTTFTLTDSATCSSTALDWGDLPNTFLTTTASNGAHHSITTGMYLGSCVDSETDGQPDAQAGANSGGDDNTAGTTTEGTCTGNDDEDGITFTTPMIPGQTACIQVSATTPAGAILNTWIDFNGDGDFIGDANEQITWTSINGGAVSTTDGAVATGTISQEYCFTVPVAATFDGGETHARFRLSTAGGLSYDGAASDGEVEDYWLAFAKIGNLVWEDTDVKGFQNEPASNGINGIQVNLIYAGSDGTLDTADDITYSTTTANDGTTDGIYGFCGLIPGNYRVQVPTVPTFPQGPGEPTLANVGTDDLIDSDTTFVEFSIPDPPTTLLTGENGTGDNPGMINNFPDAQDNLSFDFGYVPPVNEPVCEEGVDCPCEDGDEPCHIIDPNLKLGPLLGTDPMTGGGPGGDMDGITIPSDLRPSITFQIQADVRNTTGNPAYLFIWIDWNNDGTLDPTGERVVLASDTPGPLPSSFSVTIPDTAPLDTPLLVLARLASVPSLDPCGCTTAGEVEAYSITITCPTGVCIPPQINVVRGN